MKEIEDNQRIELEKTKILESIETPDVFIKSCLKLKRECSYDSPEFDSFLLTTVDRYKIDIFDFCNQAAHKDQDIFQIALLVNKLIESFHEINHKSLVSFINIFSKKTKNDGASGILFDPIRRLSVTKKQIADDLESLIKGQDDKQLYAYLQPIYSALSETDLDAANLKTLNLISDSDLIIKSIGLRILGQINLKSTKVSLEIENIIFENIKAKDIVLAAAATASLCLLQNRVERYNEFLNEIASSSIAEIQYEIVNQLRLKTGKLNSIEAKVLIATAHYDLKNKGITDAIDSILYFLVKENDQDTVIRFFKAWIDQHNKSEISEYRVDRCFHSTFYELGNNKELISEIIFLCLNGNDSKYQEILGDVLSYFRAHKSQIPNLPQKAIDALNLDDFHFLVKKILGYVLESDQQLILAFALLRSKNIGTDEENLFLDMIINYIGYNYGNSTIKFLKRLITDPSLTDKMLTIANKSIIEIQNGLNEILQLSRLNELKPKLDDLVLINKAKRKKMSFSMDQVAPESSIFNFVTKVVISEGRSWFSYNHKQYTQISKMGHFSEGYELPRYDVLDEVGASIQRLSFRSAKRNMK